MTSEQDDGGMGTERIGSTLPEASVKSSASEAESSEGESSDLGAPSEDAPIAQRTKLVGRPPLQGGLKSPDCCFEVVDGRQAWGDGGIP